MIASVVVRDGAVVVVLVAIGEAAVDISRRTIASDGLAVSDQPVAGLDGYVGRAVRIEADTAIVGRGRHRETA